MLCSRPGLKFISQVKPMLLIIMHVICIVRVKWAFPLELSFSECSTLLSEIDALVLISAEKFKEGLKTQQLW